MIDPLNPARPPHQKHLKNNYYILKHYSFIKFRYLHLNISELYHFSWMDEDVVEALTPYLIKGKPNTYTFTKHLAENLLVDEAGDLPVAILRPSIVGGAWKEPMPVCRFKF
jgi:nucleoside-diphosphate-sugar epimerase